MTIHIETLTFEVIIGLLDFERERPQHVIVDMEAYYDYTGDNFIDYAQIVTHIQEVMKQERYRLLEDALIGVQKSIHLQFPQIQRLFIKISKPDILKECTVSLSKTWDY